MRTANGSEKQPAIELFNLNNVMNTQYSRLRAHLPVAGVRDGVVVCLGLVLAEDVAGDLEAVGGALSAQVALPRSSHYIRLDEDNVLNIKSRFCSYSFWRACRCRGHSERGLCWISCTGNTFDIFIAYHHPNKSKYFEYSLRRTILFRKYLDQIFYI